MWVPAFLLDPTVALSMASGATTDHPLVSWELCPPAFCLLSLSQPALTCSDPMDHPMAPETICYCGWLSIPCPCLLLPVRTSSTSEASIMLSSPSLASFSSSGAQRQRFITSLTVGVLVNTRKKGHEPLSGLALKNISADFLYLFPNFLY